MKRLFRLRSVALIATIAMMGATAFVASGATGAFFTDAESGTLTGNLGSIQVDTTNMDFTLSNLLPGEPQSVSVTFTNAGLNPQDLYLVFDADAVNELVGFGAAISIVRADTTVLWNSPYWAPITSPLMIHDNVASGASGTFTATLTIDPSMVAPNSVTPLPDVSIDYEIVATQVGIAPGA